MSQNNTPSQELQNTFQERSIQAPADFKAVICVGPTGSGKLAWAKEYALAQRQAGKKWLVLCRDELRLDLLREAGTQAKDLPSASRSWNYTFSNPLEAKVHAQWIGRAIWAAEQGFEGILCADTNLDGGRSATSALAFRLGLAHGQMLRKLFDCSPQEAIAADEARSFQAGSAEITKQFHKLGRTLALRKSLPKAPKIQAWCLDGSSGFEMPKSLLPKTPKAAKAKADAKAVPPAA